METVTEVISTNYVWFIAGGIILLLAIIGLISEQKKKKNGGAKEEKIEEVSATANTTSTNPIEEPVSEEKKAATENLFGSTAATEETKYNLYGSQNGVNGNEFGTPITTSAADVANTDGYEPQSLGTEPIVPATSEDLFAPLEASEVKPVETITEPTLEPVVETTLEPTVVPVEEPVVEPTLEPAVESFSTFEEPATVDEKKVETPVTPEKPVETEEESTNRF